MMERYLDCLSLRWKGNVPKSDSIPYVDWWMKLWHKTPDNFDRYVARYVVWC